MCVLIFSTTFFWNSFHSKKNWARYNQKPLLVFMWSTLLLSDFNENWIFSADFIKRLKYQISWKSFQWEPSCSIQTDTTNQTVALQNFANAPQKRVCVGTASLYHSIFLEIISNFLLPGTRNSHNPIFASLYTTNKKLRASSSTSVDQSYRNPLILVYFNNFCCVLYIIHGLFWFLYGRTASRPSESNSKLIY